MVQGCRSGPPDYLGWQAGTITPWQSRLYPPSQGLRIQVSWLSGSPTACAGILKQYMGARNRVGVGLSHRSNRLNSLAELIPWNRFLGFLKVKKFGQTRDIFPAWILISGYDSWSYLPWKSCIFKYVKSYCSAYFWRFCDNSLLVINRIAPPPPPLAQE